MKAVVIFTIVVTAGALIGTVLTSIGREHPSEEWVRIIDAPEHYEGGNSVAVGSDGGIYVATTTMIVKYDVAGNQIWSRSALGYYPDNGNDIATAADGSIYILESQEDSTSPGIAKYDQTGNQLWFYSDIPIWNYYDSWSCAAGDGYVLWAGEYNGVFLKKIDSLGNQLWECSIGLNPYVDRVGVAATTDGGAYLAGMISSSLLALSNISLYRYDALGNLNWYRTWCVNGITIENEIAVAADNSFYLTGCAGMEPGLIDTFIVKFDGTGNQLWNHTLSTAWTDTGRGVAVAIDGGVFVVGEQYVGFQKSDAFVARYSTDGVLLWSRLLTSGIYSNKANGVAVSGDGAIYMIGTIGGLLDSGYRPILYRLCGHGQCSSSSLLLLCGAGGTAVVAIAIAVKVKRENRGIPKQSSEPSRPLEGDHGESVALGFEGGYFLQQPGSSKF